MKHINLRTLRANARAARSFALGAAVLGAGLLGLAPHTFAQAADVAAAHQAPDNAELLRLLEAQARRIEQLEERLASVAPTAEANRAVHYSASAATDNAAALRPRVEALEANAKAQPTLNWSRGAAPRFTSPDGGLSFRLRGRLFADVSGTGGSRFGDLNNTGTEIRSLRFGAEGAYNRLSWVIEGDFADNSVAWKSAYLALGHKLFGKGAELSVGNRLEDRGFDGASGGGNTPFQDRNVVGLALQPAHGNFGVGLTERITGETWHASFAVTGNDLSNPGNNRDTVTYSTRVHLNPIKSERGTLHLGAWALYEDIAKGDGIGLRNWRQGGHFNDNAVTRPGALAGVTSAHAYGAELAGFFGPLWAYGEWGQRELKSAAVGRRDYEAYAVSAGWFLGGAKPAYNARAGTWAGVKVATPVTAGGAGVWELKARYESLDYTKLPTGGDGDAWTLGANWYLNNNSRILFDAVYWETNNRSGAYQGEDDGYTLNARFQVTF